MPIRSQKHACHTVPAVKGNTLYDLADLFKVFGDSTRLRLLYGLFDRARCVKHLAESLQLSHSAVSHQLNFLKHSKLVKSHREGQTIVYELADKHVKTIFQQGLKHVQEGK